MRGAYLVSDNMWHPYRCDKAVPAARILGSEVRNHKALLHEGYTKKRQGHAVPTRTAADGRLCAQNSALDPIETPWSSVLFHVGKRASATELPELADVELASLAVSKEASFQAI